MRRTSNYRSNHKKVIVYTALFMRHLNTNGFYSMDQPYPLRNEFLCTMRIKVIDSYIMEDIPAGIRRRIDILGDGEILGPKLNGIILPGGADALLTRKDGSLTPDVRLVARTDDDAMIFIQYRGVRHGSHETVQPGPVDQQDSGRGREHLDRPAHRPGEADPSRSGGES